MSSACSTNHSSPSGGLKSLLYESFLSKWSVSRAWFPRYYSPVVQNSLCELFLSSWSTLQSLLSEILSGSTELALRAILWRFELSDIQPAVSRKPGYRWENSQSKFQTHVQRTKTCRFIFESCKCECNGWHRGSRNFSSSDDIDSRQTISIMPYNSALYEPDVI